MLAAAALAAPAAASGQSAERGIYLGASVGAARSRDACVDVALAFTCQDTDVAMRLFGGYQVNRHLALEAGFADLGEVKLTAGSANAAIKSTAFDFAAIISWPLNPEFFVYGRLGMYYGRAEASAAGGAVLTGPSASTYDDLTYGLGARFDFRRHFGVRLEWQRYNDFNGTDIDTLGVAALYRF
jgi:OOP family OmpA-OmpF porin